MKVRRVLIYEGPEEWIRHTLERSIFGELQVSEGKKIINKSVMDMGKAMPFEYENKAIRRNGPNLGVLTGDHDETR